MRGEKNNAKTGPRSGTDHRALVLTAGPVLLWLHLLPPDRWPGLPCLFHQITGAPCPFCGFTRGLAALVRGEWAGALAVSPLACLAYPALFLALAWGLAGLVLGASLPGPSGLLAPQRRRWTVGAALAVLAAGWAWRLAVELA